MKKLTLLLFLLPHVLLAQRDSVSLLLTKSLKNSGKDHVQSMLFHLESPENGFLYSEGFGRDSKRGEPVSGDAQFRVASITKTFLATLVLQLAETRKLQLSDRASQYLQEIDYLNFGRLHLLQGQAFADSITIEQLLQHRTGLADIFNDKGNKFYLGMYLHKKRQYSPRAIVEKYYQYQLNQTPHFAPGEGFFYSDMNYVLLGLIIEKIAQKPLAAVLREQILDPLHLQNSFFEFYETPTGHGRQLHQYVNRIDMTRINTSFDWAGGGLVSTTGDLATFAKALFGGKLISQSSLALMTDMQFTGENHNRYGLGLYESEYNGKIFYGHYGFYGSYMGYCPRDQTVLVYNISQSNTGFSVYKLMENLLRLGSGSQADEG